MKTDLLRSAHFICALQVMPLILDLDGVSIGADGHRHIQFAARLQNALRIA